MIKEKQERRKVILSEMEGLFNKATSEKREFTDEEQTRYDALDSEADTLSVEIPKLEKMEARKKEIALENEAKALESRKVLDANAKVEKRTADVKDVDLASPKEVEKRNVQVFKMLKGIMSHQPHKVDEARNELAQAGHFDDILTKEQITEKRGFNTLLDQDGALLLPTTVSSQVIDIMQDYGVVPRLALNLGDISQNSLKVPQILGRPSFTAVGQGAAITGSGFNLGAIELKALKWGAIINWTNEVSDSVAAKLMPIIMNKVAEGLAYAQDDAFFNGDATSSYNGIRGLENLVGSVDYVRLASAVSGNVSHATLDADDFLTPQMNVAPGTRAGGVYVMHPNMLFTLMKLRDTAGNYIYGSPSELAPMGTLFRKPIETSEAFNITDGVSESVCAFFNPSYLGYATGRNLTADELREGVITDEDSNSVNLATTDQKALRFTSLFDLVLSSVTRTTDSTAQGAFSVLRNAAS